jgi:hypothetical protein
MAAAWTTLMLHDATVVNRARLVSLTAAVEVQRAHQPSVRRTAQAMARVQFANLQRVATLNPDRSYAVYEGLLVAIAGNRPAGVGRLVAYTRSFPKDLVGWATLGRLTNGYDAQTAVRARLKLRRLDPLGG